MDLLKGIGLDHYQRAAQLQPAALVIAPITASAALWAPKASTIIGSLVTGAVTLGLLNFAMQFARARGRAVQRRIVQKNGALASALALRHIDGYLPADLKIRYHAALRKHGFNMPSSKEESDNPEAALSTYKSVTAWLPDQTRDLNKFALLHVENRSYGFRRNLLGLKPFGLFLIIVSCIINACLMWKFYQDTDRLIAGGILEACMITGLAGWLFAVNDAFVEDASWAYAARQLSALDILAEPPARRASRSKTAPVKSVP